ncbi:unnamed protein product [Zymoseptoria tritici ST99CH_1E4]|uniref:Granulins domain-containing protein n=1 Tax=Zymoseptoria tritici ST99CH_1E4 TaxID=1276532 RepID=A0A2H1GC79_ZYMTR|nr:unnamed protein product [Zymoseptoria tritici ST99CH_1E4]
MKVLTYTWLTLAAAAIGACYRIEPFTCINDHAYCADSGSTCCSERFQCLNNECQKTCNDGGTWCQYTEDKCCQTKGSRYCAEVCN